MSARAAEPKSCASTQGNLRGGRSPHTSWLPRADLGRLPTVRLSGSTPGLEPQGPEGRGELSLSVERSFCTCVRFSLKHRSDA